MLFQSTPPCGGDLGAWLETLREVISIHAPLRGRRYDSEGHVVAVRISIHAPLRGRQDLPDPGLSDFFISIHAPLRGRPYSRAHHQLRPDFNPRPLAGATSCRASLIVFMMISIHAPLRGRRSNIHRRLLVFPISIHAPLRGRPKINKYKTMDKIFQSTPPCGGDKGRGQKNKPHLKFQSTPPCGGDMSELLGIPKRNIISIHAPLRGRPLWTTEKAGKADFNPRPLAGATFIGHFDDTEDRTFQSTPPCGGDC